MSQLSIDVSEVVARYFAAWNAPADKLRVAVEAVYVEDAYYCDGAAEAIGIAAVEAMIGGVMAQFDGARFELASAVDHHHQQARFGWVMKSADGDTIIDGIDAVRFTEDGKISTVLGFFGTSIPDGSGGATEHTFRWEQTYDTTTDRLFAVVSNLDLYAEVAPNLASIQVLEGEGLGMVRQCTNPEGESWMESYTEWVPGERFVAEVDVSTYPPSLAAMIEALTMSVVVEAVDDARSRVVIEVATELTDLGVQVFCDGGAADGLFGPILDGWAAAIA